MKEAQFRIQIKDEHTWSRRLMCMKLLNQYTKENGAEIPLKMCYTIVNQAWTSPSFVDNVLHQANLYIATNKPKPPVVDLDPPEDVREEIVEQPVVH